MKSLYQKPQLQSLFQGFRLVGGVTKGGSRTQAFITGDKVNIDYLNSFVTDEYTVKELTYKSKLTLKEAAAKYNLTFIPLQEKFDEAASKCEPTYWLRDGVHPTLMGHELIKKAWLEAFSSL